MRFKPVLTAVLVILAGMILAVALLAANLPMAAQWVIQHRYGSVLSSRQMQFQVSHVGKDRAMVTGLKWGSGISADLAVISYDIQGFRLPDLQNLTLTGLTVEARYDPEHGLVVDPVFQKEKAPQIPLSGNGAVDWLPYLPDRVQVTNARLILTMNQKVMVIPFTGSLSKDRSARQVVCEAVFHPFGQPVTLKTRVHPVAGVETFHLKARGFDFQPLLAGFLSMDKKAVWPGISDWSVEKSTHNTWEVVLSDMMMASPAGLVIPHFQARALMEPHQVSVLGEVGMAHPFVSDLRASIRALVVRDPSGSGFQGMDLVCEMQPMEKVTVRHQGAAAVLQQPLAALSLHVKDRLVDGVLTTSFSQADLQRQEKAFSSGRGSVQSDIHGDFNTGALSMDLVSHLSGIQVTGPDSVVRVRRLDAAGTVSLDMAGESGDTPRADLEVELVSGSVTVPDKNVAVQGIWAQIPVTYPHAQGAGRFSVEKLLLDNRAVLTGKGRILRTGKQDVRFDGTFQVPDSNAVTVSIDVTAGLNPDLHLQVAMDTNRFRLSPSRFEHLVPRPPFPVGYDLDVQVSGVAGWENHRLTTGADLVIHGGTLSMPDQDLAVSGIQGRLALNDLLAPSSVPGQMVTIQRIQAGDFEATDAVLRFTLDPGPSLVLENLRVNWAGGRVSMESFRIPAPDRSVALTLYCDRIELNRLLAQLGGFDAQGNGSLNGRIPVVFKNGEISFDNAFLFSTPGQGGRIVIRNPEKLVAGIPMDTPRFSQLDLAAEALKDFEYAWAKLTFDTRGETLTANMELDGKPGRVLPFVYEKDINSFVRVDAESPGSRFQGIKLDVNLTLPFNQVVTLGNRIRKLFN